MELYILHKKKPVELKTLSFNIRLKINKIVIAN